MAAILYFVAAAASAVVWNRAFSHEATPPVRWVSNLVMASITVLLPVQGAATLQLLGWIGSVRIGPLAALQVAGLGAGLMWVWRTQKPVAQAAQGAPAVGPDLPCWPLSLSVCAGVVAASYLLFALNLFTSYPGGSDALTYHLPVALHWLQSGSLRIPSLGARQYALPGNGELGMMLFLSTRHEAWVPLVNMVAGLLFAISTYEIARRLAQGSTVAAAAVTIIALSMPILEFQAFSGYIDMFGSAFLLAAVALFLAWKDTVDTTARGRLLVLSAIACGVSVGTKPVFYVYAGVFCVVVTVALVRESGLSSREFARAGWPSLLPELRCPACSGSGEDSRPLVIRYFHFK